jgi:predicted ATP-dependent serine protease
MFAETRLKEASVLGFKRGIIPAQSIAEESPSLMETLRVRDLRQAQEVFFS